jgi:alcohol dehydrogenase/propanol-preferring alcohol dehydrogenase
MKAAVISKVNGPWEIRDVADPRPGAGEVLIKIHACGMCVNDVFATKGLIPFPAISPAITGHEPVGEVVEVGPGVSSRKVGDRVGTTWIRGTCGRCDYCRHNYPVSGQAALCCASPTATGFTVQGGHAELMVVAATQTVLIPEGLASELAAPVLCAGYTSWCALRHADPKPHERIAVLGIGGLGHLALQFSRACGFQTIAITRSPCKRDISKELGADIVVSTGDELRAAGGADVILVTGSSYEAATDSLAGLRPDGRLVLAGIDPVRPFVIPQLAIHPFFGLRHQILGSTHNGVRYLQEALDLVASGAVTPMIETFPKEDVNKAVEKVDKGEVRFKAVIIY